MSGAQKNAAARQAVRASVERINVARDLKKIELDAEEFLGMSPDGGATLTGYYRGGVIYRMTTWIGLSYGNDITEYYLDSGRIIFIYERLQVFGHDSLTGDVDLSRVQPVFEGRYYFQQGRLTDHMIKGARPFGESDDEVLPRKIADGIRYRNLLLRKIQASR